MEFPPLHAARNMCMETILSFPFQQHVSCLPGLWWTELHFPGLWVTQNFIQARRSPACKPLITEKHLLGNFFLNIDYNFRGMLVLIEPFTKPLPRQLNMGHPFPHLQKQVKKLLVLNYLGVCFVRPKKRCLKCLVKKSFIPWTLVKPLKAKGWVWLWIPLNWDEKQHPCLVSWGRQRPENQKSSCGQCIQYNRPDVVVWQWRQRKAWDHMSTFPTKHPMSLFKMCIGMERRGGPRKAVAGTGKIVESSQEA